MSILEAWDIYRRYSLLAIKAKARYEIGCTDSGAIHKFMNLSGTAEGRLQLLQADLRKEVPLFKIEDDIANVKRTVSELIYYVGRHIAA